MGFAELGLRGMVCFANMRIRISYIDHDQIIIIPIINLFHILMIQIS